ncbi:FAD-binding and (Fe-S)-binding domain-containing protein [Alkalimonas delamerensis]|uniref:FAD-binding and (Fe-S)-binding domain-containing protein n=1 Tax=Alkalimonas delamerensis TaxID=265981 RepID=A0ABT9GNX7_9GAMM|nr:FAD-binding and (Fe-S)-binding domain-containing protein [Alkalimonas delamerensis]MDP4528675.1 FAD-binding and (Fe-S)-binding domain-containing protein [Alkalimonas delamerensis]
MIPNFAPEAALDPSVRAFCQALRTAGFAGDIETSYGSRLAVATDNSVYQSLPQAVLLPKHSEDVVLLTSLAQTSSFRHLKFSPRGGGTGTNGQSLTEHLVVDLSRHLRAILEINVEERWVRVQSGVIKDQLNAFLKPYGFFFAPDLSTSNRATIGGMINTDASGQGSLVYGKTSDHTLALTTVLMDGSVLKTSKEPVVEAEKKASQGGTIGQIYRQVLTSCRDFRPQILQTFPRLNRFLTGYDLEHVFNDDLTEFDLSRIITGSEGSLGFVTEAKLSITPIARHKCLLNIKYDSFESALRNAPFLVAAQATSVETVDSKVLDLARNDIIWQQVEELITDVPGKTMQGLNMVEYNSEDQADIEQKIAALTERLDAAMANGEHGIIGYQLTYDTTAIGHIYAMRKKAVGLLGNTPGSQKPIAFAEDTAVPPEKLADFILEFRRLLDAQGLHYGMFGHVDAGVLHVRPALDLCDPEQEKLMRSISDQVVALTAKYGGLMWGEHGKGYRSEYGPEFFGETLFNELRKIKGAFDPYNRVNPGKICTPLQSADSLVSVDGPKRAWFDRQIPVAVKESFDSSLNCNGNGLCFNFDANSPMCPSSKVTKDRRHSPKGRAGLMREWLRLAEVQGVDILATEQRLQHGAAGVNFWQRLKNSWAARQGEADFSHEVKEAMDGCLACKACASQCPINVDVPSFRARFLQLYHGRYLRPAKDYIVANIERTAPWLAKAPALVNWFLRRNWVQRSLAATVGYVDTPLLSEPSLANRLQQRYTFDLNRLQQANADERSRMVLLVQDPFTSFYEAELVEDALSLLEKLGKTPMLLPFLPNGKPQHVKGFLRDFVKTASKASDFLNQLHQFEVPMLGLDASLVLVYRDEYRKLLGDKRGNYQVDLFHEWLAQQPIPTAKQQGSFALLAHCTEKTALPKTEQSWQQIFSQAGLELKPVSVGCCGMAGTYGHEQQNLENSKALFAMSWQAPLQQFGVDQVLVTGFSCRSQVKRLAGSKPKHPLQQLLQAIG